MKIAIVVMIITSLAALFSVILDHNVPASFGWFVALLYQAHFAVTYFRNNPKEADHA